LPLIRAIVDLAHGLGLTVIAEGVETENQLEAQIVAGCDPVRGYLIHRPQPASEEVLVQSATMPKLRFVLCEASVRE
jgi:EAL domain-containing protein (putative c-di-GMP-specific phosphodiesterase class I)